MHCTQEPNTLPMRQSALEFGFTLTFAFSTGKCNRLKIGTYSSCVDSELSSFINLIIVSVCASI